MNLAQLKERSGKVADQTSQAADASVRELRRQLRQFVKEELLELLQYDREVSAALVRTLQGTDLIAGSLTSVIAERVGERAAELVEDGLAENEEFSEKVAEKLAEKSNRSDAVDIVKRVLSRTF